MSLADRLARHENPQRGLPCPVAVIVAQLDETDRKALLNAMDAPSNHPDRVSSAELARMLTEEGFAIHFKGIERHRNRVCRCFTGSSRVAPESP